VSREGAGLPRGVPMRFTIEANALGPEGAEWRPAVAELIELARVHPDLLDVARTPGARRERASPERARTPSC